MQRLESVPPDHSDGLIMGINFRKSFRLGPFQVNVGKSGVGYSVGRPGIRVGRSAKGRRYTTFSIPGTGVSYRKNLPANEKGCAVMLAAGVIGLISALIAKAAK